MQKCKNKVDNKTSTILFVDDLPGYPVECQQKQTIHLWRFLKELLLQPERYDRYIRWVNRQEGIFKIEDSPKVAKLWGKRKNRPAMNYDKLSRSIRQYYRKGIIKKTANSKRLVYQFCPAYLWFLIISNEQHNTSSGCDRSQCSCDNSSSPPMSYPTTYQSDRVHAAVLHSLPPWGIHLRNKYVCIR